MATQAATSSSARCLIYSRTLIRPTHVNPLWCTPSHAFHSQALTLPHWWPSTFTQPVSIHASLPVSVQSNVPHVECCQNWTLYFKLFSFFFPSSLCFLLLKPNHRVNLTTASNMWHTPSEVSEVWFYYLHGHHETPAARYDMFPCISINNEFSTSLLTWEPVRPFSSFGTCKPDIGTMTIFIYSTCAVYVTWSLFTHHVKERVGQS